VSEVERQAHPAVPAKAGHYVRFCAFALIVLTANALQSSSQRPDVRFLPTPQNVVDAMLTLAHVTPADVVFDLGSGDGRIPITAATKFGARGVGVEIDANLVRLARENAARAGVSDRVSFIEGDLFQADLSSATVVALFLLPSMNMRLIPKFQRELRPGSRIVSHHFAMGDRWEPDAEQDVSGLMIYLWNRK
jgi:cyclopropane fatty-acyl-phospholipid synthase-like methyltransferase